MPAAALLPFLSFLAFTSLGLPDGLLGVAWPSMRESFGLPLDRLGALVAAATAGYLVSSFLGGAILRRMSVGSLLALSTGAASAALLGMAASPSPATLLAAASLSGLGGGAIDAGLNAYGARHFSARTLNWLHAFFGLGTTIGPLLVTAVLGAGLEWRWAYAAAGVAQLVLAIVFVLTRHRWRHGGAGPPPAAPASTLGSLRQPRVWLGMALFFVYSGVEMVTAQWSYTLLVLGRGLSETAGGLYVTAFWASLMIGRIAFGLVAGRVPLGPALRFCLAGAAAGALLLWLAPIPVLWLVGLMTIGIAAAPVFATLVSLTPVRVGVEHADSAIGFQIAAAGLGGAALTGVVGLIARAVGLEAIGASVLVLALLLLALHAAAERRTSAAPRATAAVQR